MRECLCVRECVRMRDCDCHCDCMYVSVSVNMYKCVYVFNSSSHLVVASFFSLFLLKCVVLLDDCEID